jgi:hypothetical protein
MIRKLVLAGAFVLLIIAPASAEGPLCKQKCEAWCKDNKPTHR